MYHVYVLYENLKINYNLLHHPMQTLTVSLLEQMHPDLTN